MRVVFAITPGHGHLYPTLPLARALARAGHATSYAMIDAPSLRAAIEARGHDFVALPPTQAEQQARFAEAWADLATLDPEALAVQGLARLFVPLVEPALDPLVAHLRGWRADLVVHELTAFFAPLAAAIVGLPSVNHGTGFGFPASAHGAGDAMAAEWRAHGFVPDPMAGIYRGLHLDLFPPSVPDPILASLDPERVHALRPVPLRSTGPARPVDAGSRPRIVATLGTVFDDDPAAWSAIESALASRNLDVVSLRPGDGFVPIGDVVAGAAAIVAHGGAGTVLAGLTEGVPLVLLPRGADQAAITEAAVRAGVAVEVAADPSSITDGLDQVLGGQLDANLERVRREIEAMPDPAALVEVLVEHQREDPPWQSVSFGDGPSTA
jgi:UDP:flavonoid glycosyltransferase YjiC (YdhE family)